MSASKTLWLATAILLVVSHAGHHLAHRTPGTLTLAIRLALVVILFVLGSAMRQERRVEKEAHEKSQIDKHNQLG